MNPQFHCREENRRRAVRDQGVVIINGIDFLEIASPDQLTLLVVFIHPVPGETGEVPAGAPPLAAENFRIDGGVRVTGIQVLKIDSVSKNAVTLRVNARGDFSTYTLRLVSSLTDDQSPKGFDPRLATVPFSFKAECPNPFDCDTPVACPPPTLHEPPLNYLAKDYGSFRRLMLDRLSTLLPDWRDASPADPLVTLVETLAYAADQLSYQQDAAATEAYLGTARRRTSLRRHARLLDYRVHNGCNARAWIHLAVEKAKSGDAKPADGFTLPASAEILSRGIDPSPTLATAQQLADALRDGPVVFATLHDLTLRHAQNEIAFHTWSDGSCCLPRKATRATLQNDPPTLLQSGDWLLFEEIASPSTGLAADADPQHRHVVRLTRAEPETDPLDGTAILEIEWAPADALPFPLCVSARMSAQDPPFAVSMARGNIVLADHGFEGAAETVVIEEADIDRPPFAALARPNVTMAAPFALDSTGASGALLTAAAAMQFSPADPLPAVSIEGVGETWKPRRDLLGSGRFAPEFVVETEPDGSATVRFGNGIHGLRPPAGVSFAARYRTGNGREGNVGAETLTRIDSDRQGISAVRNPLPAHGGTDPELPDQVRQFAPQAFRTQERAVTVGDWVGVAQKHPEVQRAAAAFCWTGSWHTVFVTIDRFGGLSANDPLFQTDLRRHLERYRLAGYDLEINNPIFVPLDLALMVCVQPGYRRADVEKALLDTFSAKDLPDGRRGFFHPDNFTFGQPVYLSRIYAAAMAVAGVASARATVFQRFGKTPNGELDAGLIAFAPLEIARCDNDPSFPENGQIVIDPQGGL